MPFIVNPLDGTGLVPKQTLVETKGGKLRRLASVAHTVDPWNRGYMSSVPGWQPSEVLTIGQMRVHGGRIYVALNAGTTASSGGPTRLPTQTLSGGQLDGTVYWAYWAENTVTTDPSRTLVTWSASLAVTLGQYISTGVYVYRVTTAGTTGASAPTGTSNAETDGTATLSYQGVLVVNPYAADFPTVTQSTSAPTGLNRIFYAAQSGNFSAVKGFVISGGSGYAVGDTVTLSGGTNTTPVTVRVTRVSSGVAKTVSIVTAGAYTALPTAAMTQASTSGSGTGITVEVAFTEPAWCKVYGGYCFGGSGPHVRIFNMQPTDNAAMRGHSNAYEFYTDAQRFNFILTSNNAGGVTIYIDGVRYSLNRLAPNASTQYVDVTFPAGKKTRLIRIEQNGQLNLQRVQVDTYSTVWKPQVQINRLVCVSDSIMDGAGFYPFVPGNTIPLRIGWSLGFNDVWALVQGSTGYVNRGSSPGSTTDSFGYRVPQILDLNPDLVVVMGSTNDNGLSGISTAVQTFLSDLRNGGYTNPIVVVGVLSINQAAVATTEAAVSTGVSAFADPLAKTYFIPVYNDPYMPWITGSWNNNPAPSGITDINATNASLYINTNDNVHESDLGAQYLSGRIVAAIEQSVYPNIN